MYPQTDLTELGGRKLVLRQRIALRRWQCAIDARRAAQPLVLLDKAYVRWQAISPFAKLAIVPATLLLKKMLFPKARVAKSALRWVPAIAGAVWKIASRRRADSYAARW